MAGLLLSISFSSPHKMLRWSSIRKTRIADAVATVAGTPLHGDRYVDDRIAVVAMLNDGLSTQHFDSFMDGPRRKFFRSGEARSGIVAHLRHERRHRIAYRHTWPLLRR